MQKSLAKIDDPQWALITRYAINGICATAVHFGLLYFNITVLQMPSAGLANLCASVGGITASFFGSRYFVFPPTGETMLSQAARFGLLYFMIACLHGAVIYGWTDIAHHDYRTGFLIATIMQTVLSFFGNKYLVFSTR